MRVIALPTSIDVRRRALKPALAPAFTSVDQSLAGRRQGVRPFRVIQAGQWRRSLGLRGTRSRRRSTWSASDATQKSRTGRGQFLASRESSGCIRGKHILVSLRARPRLLPAHGLARRRCSHSHDNQFAVPANSLFLSRGKPAATCKQILTIPRRRKKCKHAQITQKESLSLLYPPTGPLPARIGRHGTRSAPDR